MVRTLAALALLLAAQLASADTIIRGGAKGTTKESRITSTPSGANHQPADVAIYDAAGNLVTPPGSGQLPAALGPQSAAASLPVTLSTDGVVSTCGKGYPSGAAVSLAPNNSDVTGTATKGVVYLTCNTGSVYAWLKAGGTASAGNNMPLAPDACRCIQWSAASGADVTVHAFAASATSVYMTPMTGVGP